MTKPTRFPEEFKIEAVMQVTERGHRVAEVAAGSLKASTAYTFGSSDTVILPMCVQRKILSLTNCADSRLN